MLFLFMVMSITRKKDYAPPYAPFSGLFDRVVTIMAIYFLRDELF
jgi:hypothetical protein